MFSKYSNRRAFPIALAVLMVMTAAMMIRGGMAVSSVVSLSNQMVVAGGGEAHRLSPQVVEAARKDSLLAKIDGAVADPFRTGATRPAEIRPNSALPEQPVYSLVLNGLLFDERDPVVQLGFGPEASGWLHVGDTWKNWKVEAISQRNVTLRRGGRTLVLG